MLTQRQSKIIQFLLGRNDYTTVNAVSGNFEISPRTARYDLKEIGFFLEQNGIVLKSVPSKGVKIIADAKQQKALKKLISDSRIFSKAERDDLIVLRLLLGDVCTYESLSEIAEVSRNTVYYSIESVEDILEKHGLSLVKNKGEGIHAEGEEDCFRECFLSVIDRYEDYQVFSKVMVSFCSEENILRSLDIISSIEDALKVSFYRTDQLKMILCYVLYRIENGHTVDQLENRFEKARKNKHHEIYSLALEKFDLSENEKLYLIALFMNSKVRNLEGNRKTDSVSEEISGFLLEELEKLHRLDDAEKERFLAGLSAHLDVALYRIRNRIPIVNDLRDQIRICIPLTYDFTKKQLLKCEERYGISFSEDEISYIAMYVGSTYETSVKTDMRIKIILVCSFGMTTSSILESRLKQLLPDCDIIGSFSISDAENYLKDHVVDLIISTNDHDYGDYRKIVVNPLLHKQDVDYIRATIFEISYDKMCSSFLDRYANIDSANKKTYIRDIIPAEYIQIVDQADSWRDSIRLAAKPLLQAKKIEQKYIDRMIEVVEEFGTYMVILPETAFVHAGSNDGINEESCSLLVMKEPLLFGDTNPIFVRNVVVIGIKSKEKVMILDVANILDRKDNLNELKDPKISVERILDLHD